MSLSSMLSGADPLLSGLADRYDTTHRLTWRDTARSDQLPPGEWGRIWYVRGGRGGGKTWTGSNNFADLLAGSAPGEWGVIAPTYADARDTCVESQKSGLIKALGGKCGPGGVLLEKGPHIAQWNRSMGQLWLRNGSVVYVDGADDGALRIQGKNLSGCWCDEIGLWKQWKTAWDESIRYAVRSAPGKIIATGTPKRSMPARHLVKRLLEDPRVAKSRLRTEDNAANLDPESLAEFLTTKGTALGRQELEGELLAEIEGALWSPDQIEASRVTEAPELVLIVVGIDPSGGDSAGNAEQGIVAAGRSADGEFYVLADRSCKLPPQGWASRAIGLYHELEADWVVAETNFGGDMVVATIRNVDDNVPVEKVTASRGKRQRAEPIAVRYGDPTDASTWARSKVHHVGMFEDLEDQMCTWDPEGGTSPDRVDALVWALTKLGAGGGDWSSVYGETVECDRCRRLYLTGPGTGRRAGDPCPFCGHKEPVEGRADTGFQEGSLAAELAQREMRR